MLEIRDVKNKEIFLQCDHSSANYPKKSSIGNKFVFTIAGCLAHCRRPFKRHYNQDPQECEKMLSMMFSLAHFEKQINDHGKNDTNTLKIRGSYSARALEVIGFAMQQAIKDKNWSDQTPLGKAALHFIKHFKKLSVYLAHPILEPTNNGSERHLRAEKLSQGSSYFRDTIEGRTRFDILRTLNQTCVSAGIPFGQYLLYILLQPDLDIKRNPENFTPLAVKKLFEADTTVASKIQRIFTRGY